MCNVESRLEITGQVTYLAPIRARYQSEVDKRVGGSSFSENLDSASYVQMTRIAFVRTYPVVSA